MTAVGGLQNLGNTCAVNSLIQCIYGTPLLRNLLIKPEKETNCDTSITTQLHDICSKLSEGNSISPKAFVHRLFQLFHFILTPGEQFDIGELWLLLGDKVSEEFNSDLPAIIPETANVVDLQVLKLNNNKSSKWQTAIQGINICITKCNTCNVDVINTDIFIILTLDLSTHTEILDMILSFFKLEELSEWTCDSCKNKGCKKQYQVYKLPDILVILIKRFNNNFQKLENPVNILEELNITHNNIENKYKLKSIGNHFGGYQGGHYTACSLHTTHTTHTTQNTHTSDGSCEQWRHIDDMSIHLINIDDIINNNRYAYILFYERV